MMEGCDDKERQKLENAVLVARSVLSCSMLHMFLSMYNKKTTTMPVLGGLGGKTRLCFACQQQQLDACKCSC